MKSTTFKWLVRLLSCAATIGAFFVFAHYQDLSDAYGAVDYFTFTVSNSQQKRPYTLEPDDTKPGDKIIVMAKMEDDDTSWVAEELPDWQRAIYTVNPSADSADVLTTAVNKGHESMAYLTYLIDNYNSSLPSFIVFLHAHRNGFFRAWHVDSPLHDNVDVLRALQLPFVARNGYVNLRCNWNPGCGRHSKNSHVNPTLFEEIFNGTSTPPVSDGVSWKAPMADAVSSKEDQDKPMYVRGHVAAACCAQFAVTSEQVLKRPVEDYIKFRDWILETKKNDHDSGRVMEFLWHIIFGQDAVYCPDEAVCYCSVFGRC